MGTQLSTWHVVEAPAVTPYRFGLFSAVEPRTASLELTGIDEHWRLGVEWESQACASVKETTGPCIDSDVTALTPDDSCSISQFDPFTLYVYNDQSVPGRTIAQAEQNAIARLTSGEQEAAEAHLWGIISTAAAPVTDLTTYTLRYGLAWVEQELAESYGGQGVIHMNRLTSILLKDMLRVEGGRLVTYAGTTVVAGGGYDRIAGTAPTTATIIGTGPLVMYRGDIDTRENAIDRSINSHSIIAQRDYVIGWDCVSLGAEVTIATPGGS